MLSEAYLEHASRSDPLGTSYMFLAIKEAIRSAYGKHQVISYGRITRSGSCRWDQEKACFWAKATISNSCDKLSYARLKKDWSIQVPLCLILAQASRSPH